MNLARGLHSVGSHDRRIIIFCYWYGPFARWVRHGREHDRNSACSPSLIRSQHSMERQKSRWVAREPTLWPGVPTHGSSIRTLHRSGRHSVTDHGGLVARRRQSWELPANRGNCRASPIGRVKWWLGCRTARNHIDSIGSEPTLRSPFSRLVRFPTRSVELVGSSLTVRLFVGGAVNYAVAKSTRPPPLVDRQS
jgi:hypothetical protein